jgi:hypothetical protein
MRAVARNINQGFIHLGQTHRVITSLGV